MVPCIQFNKGTCTRNGEHEYKTMLLKHMCKIESQENKAAGEEVKICQQYLNAVKQHKAISIIQTLKKLARKMSVTFYELVQNTLLILTLLKIISSPAQIH